MADTSRSIERPQAQKRSHPKRKINKTHTLKKRTPQKVAAQENVVYVRKNSSVQMVISQCEKLFEKQIKEIVIQCMGCAIQQGINIALQFCEKYPIFQLAVNTKTLTLIDDLEPLMDEDDYETQQRYNSAIQIRVIKTCDSHAIK